MVEFRKMGRDWDSGSELGPGFKTRVKIQYQDRDSWPESELESKNKMRLGFGIGVGVSTQDSGVGTQDSRLGSRSSFGTCNGTMILNQESRLWSGFETSIGIEICRNVAQQNFKFFYD